MREFLAVIVLALCATTIAAHAEPVQYTLSSNLSGTIGATAFTDAATVFTFVGDTNNTTALGAGFFTNDVGTGTITIAGVGTATFLSSTFGVIGSAEDAGFADLTAGFELGILDFGLVDYDLTAPFTDTGFFVDGFTQIAGPESTSLGDLTITDGDFQHATTTFQATAIAATPEPASFVLLGTGLVGLIGVARRRIA